MDTDKKIISQEGEDTSTDITPEERALLDESMETNPSFDNNNLRRSELDNTDDDGDLLNEPGTDLSGEDLDVPGAELDDEAEETGGEDEENNSYSRADTE